MTQPAVLDHAKKLREAVRGICGITGFDSSTINANDDVILNLLDDRVSHVQEGT